MKAVIEIGFEELPARFIPEFIKHMLKTLRKPLKNPRISATPRRLAVMCDTEPDADIIDKSLRETPIPKSMIWESGGLKFLRPIRWVLAVGDKGVIPIKVAGIEASNRTKGHRVLNTEVRIKRPDEYEHKLREAGVIVDHRERERVIKEDIEKVEGAKPSPELIKLAVFSTEFPVCIPCIAKDIFKGIPPLVVETVLKDKLEVIPIYGGTEPIGFIAVADNPLCYEKNENIKKGYLEVARSRMDDARFYIEEDMKIPFEDRVRMLGNIVFHEDFGSYLKRQEVLASLAEFISKNTGLSSPETVKKASLLAKADLTTGLVREFPELQGYVGMFYAQESGVEAEVAKTIYEHYLPVRVEDPLPETEVSTVLSVADKILHIVTGFKVGLELTSEADPYGLRRAARGAVQVAADRRVDIDFSDAINFAVDMVGGGDETKIKVSEFLSSRLAGFLEERGMRRDIVEAVLAKTLNPFDAKLRCSVLLGEERLKDVVIIWRRVDNILSKAEREGVKTASTVKTFLFKEEEERKLFEEVEKMEPKLIAFLEERRYKEYLSSLASLRPVVDTFFDEVLVMHEDESIRANRLGILFKLKTCMGLCDFGKIR